MRSSACCSIYFRNRNRIVRYRFRLSYFVTVLIQVSARTLPSSAAMQIEIRLRTLAAHAGRNFCIRFLICSNGAFCCSVRVALSFVSSRTTVTNDPPLSVPLAILCTVFSKNERLNAILMQHTGSLHRFFIFHNILFVNKQKQEKYICLKLHIEKSDCHPLS